MQKDLTEGPILSRLLLFSLPMTAANILQQCYNLADTMIVGRFIGEDALASVGSAYTLMVFITSILLGLSLGSSALVANYFGAGKREKMHTTIASSFILIFLLSLIITIISLLSIDWIIKALNTPYELEEMLKEYLACANPAAKLIMGVSLQNQGLNGKISAILICTFSEAKKQTEERITSHRSLYKNGVLPGVLGEDEEKIKQPPMGQNPAPPELPNLFEEGVKEVRKTLTKRRTSKSVQDPNQGILDLQGERFLKDGSGVLPGERFRDCSRTFFYKKGRSICLDVPTYQRVGYKIKNIGAER